MSTSTISNCLPSLENHVIVDINKIVTGARNVLSVHWLLLNLRIGGMGRWRDGNMGRQAG